MTLDLWDGVFAYLTTYEIHRMRLSGDKFIVSCANRSTTAYFAVRQDVTRPIPPWVSHSTRLRDLHIEAITYPKEVGVLPSCITKLNLDYVPLFYCALPHIHTNQALVEQQFPNLVDLRCHSYMNAGFWTLPSKLTRLSGYGPVFSDEVPFPPNLIHISLHGTTLTPKQAANLPPKLESLETYQTIQHLPVLPHLTDLLVYSTSRVSLEELPRILDGNTCLKSIDIDTEDFDCLTKSLPLSITSIELKMPLNNLDLQKLPRSLTAWTIRGKLQPCDVKEESDCERLAHLPTTLKRLRLGKYHLKSIPESLLNILPHHLEELDARWIQLSPTQIQALPSTLTSLRTFNLSTKAAVHLSHRTCLRRLSLYGGILRTALAKKLPPGLQYLTLVHVALITRGHYQVADSTEHRLYTVTNPNTKAISALPRGLLELVVKPQKRQTYWSQQAYLVFADLPLSIRTLVIVPHHGVPFNGLGPEFSPPPSSKMTIIQRLANLRYLHLHTYMNNATRDLFISSLPPTITALHTICEMDREVARCLPISLRYCDLACRLDSVRGYVQRLDDYSGEFHHSDILG